MAKPKQDCARDHQHRSTLRKHYRQLRRSLNTHQQQYAALSLARQLIRSPYFLRAKNITVYWPDDGEISLLPFIERAWAMNKNVYLPVVTQRNTMQFARFTPHCAIADGKWEIPLPIPTRPVKPLILDTLIIPLVAFDACGNRLGRGGGFYDRFIHQLPRFRAVETHPSGQTKNPAIIGVAHHCQRADSIPVAPWDMPVDAVCTDTALHIFS